jgi:hypothetical protein
MQNALYALAGCYGLSFFALVAGYFWARWYAVGLSAFGVIVAAVGTWQLGGLEPILMFFGGTHAAAALSLWGDSMSEPYEGQATWREKFHMDDNAVQRLGRSVMRAGISLPFVLLYGLMPRQNAGVDVVALLAGLTAIAGFAALIKMRTWGILAMAISGLVIVAHTGLHATVLAGPFAGVSVIPVLAVGALLASAAIPFAGGIRRWIAAR